MDIELPPIIVVLLTVVLGILGPGDPTPAQLCARLPESGVVVIGCADRGSDEGDRAGGNGDRDRGDGVRDDGDGDHGGDGDGGTDRDTDGTEGDTDTDTDAGPDAGPDDAAADGDAEGPGSATRRRSGNSGTGAAMFYVDPTTPAARQVQVWEDEGREDDAKQLRRISERPQPLWVSGNTGEVRSQVADYVERAAEADAIPLVVAYNIPGRDCGSYSGGGASSGAEYERWVANLADGLDGSDAWVILEPDALPQQISGCVDGEGRYDLLAGAVDTLTDAGARVYIDAGHPGYVTDVEVIAEALRRAGVDRAAGFSLNVSNFIPTADNIAYGERLSEILGGAHFVVDTSRNGAESPPRSTDGAPAWCNPPGREIGVPPTTRNTGSPLVDALLWIKRPGESDGACRDDDPRAGGWYPDYALDLTDS